MPTLAELLAQQQQSRGINEWEAPTRNMASLQTYDPSASTGTNALTGLAQGLAAGIFGQFYQKRQNDLQSDQESSMKRIFAMQNQNELDTYRQKASIEASMRAPQLDTIDLGTERKLLETSFDPETGGFQRRQLASQIQPGPKRTADEVAMERLMGVPQSVSPAAQPNQVQQGFIPTTMPTQEAAPAQPIDPIRLKAQGYAAQGMTAPEAFKIAREDFTKSQTYNSTADQLEQYATELEQAVSKAGATGPGWINWGKGVATAGMAGLGLDQPAEKTQGDADIGVIGAKFGKLQTEGMAASLVNSDIGMKILLSPIIPGTDKSPQTNLGFAQQMRQAAALARERSGELGFNPPTQPGTDAPPANVSAPQPQPAQDPQVQVVKALNLTEQGGPPPPNGGGAAPLAARVMMAESGGNPNAVSKVGAQGLMQVMPATAEGQLKKLGMQGQDPKNPEVNARIGGDYLREAVNKYNGDEKLALAAYNWGPPRVDRALKKTGGSTWEDIKALTPKETQNYVEKITNPNFAVRVAQRINENPQFAKMAGLASQAFDGMTFGLGDEIQGGINSAATGNKYTDSLNQIRSDDKAFAKENPKASMAANIAGSMVAPGAAILKGVNTAKGLTALGIAQGGAYGFGSGEGGANNRATSALTGAAFGGAGGAIGAGVAKRISAGANSNLANTLLEKLSPQRGSISSKAIDSSKKEASKLANTMFKVSRELGVTSDDLLKATKTAEDAQKRGVPLSVFDAAAVDVLPGESTAGILTNSELAQRISTLTNNSAGAKTGKAVIDTRGAEAGDRIASTLDKLAPGKTIYEGAQEFLGAIGGKVGKEKAARRAAAEPLYKAAVEETPTLDGVEKLLENPIIQKTISAVRGTDGDLTDLGDNSTKVLLAVKNELTGKISELRRAGNANQVRLHENIREKILSKLPAKVREADQVYSKGSGTLNALSEGQFDAMKELAKGDSLGALKRLKNMQPEEIEGFKSALGAEYEGQLKAGVKSALLDKLRASTDGTNKDLVSLIVGSPKDRGTLKSLLGADDYNDIISTLRDEKRLQLANKAYFKGSSTSGNITDLAASQNAIEGAVNIGEQVGEAVKGGPSGIIGSLIKTLARSTRGTPNAELEEQMTKVMLDPQASIDIAKRLAPLLARAERRAGRVDAATSGGSRLATIMASRKNN